MNTQESDRQAYAQEQFDLGLSFYTEGNIKKAREHWNKVIREDDPSVYAWSQNNLGFSFYTEGNIKKAREHWNKVIREDDPSVYAWSQNNLGLSFGTEGNIEKSREHWYKVIRDDNPSAYALSQYALGWSFDKEGNIEKSREHWNKVIREDNPSAYAWSQYNLGLSFNTERKTKTAREHWYKVIRDDNPSAYAWSQHNLGLTFGTKGNIETAREHWYKVIREDNSSAYAWSQYALGLSFGNEENIEKAREHWSNFRSYQELFKDNGYRNDLRIYNTQKILICLYNNRQEVSEDLLKLTEFFNNIQQYVMNIQEYLHINPANLKNSENYFSHYTRVDIAEKIIKNGSFHLGIANYMNDPTEGKILFKEWNIPLDYNDNLMAFLTSFTFNENSLNQFRLYGKQDGKDGSGLSLVVNSQFFDSILDFDKNLNSNMELLTGNVVENLNELNIKKKTIPEKLQLFRCIYMKPETDYISIAHRSKLSFFLDSTLEDPEKVWQDYLEKMNEITYEVKTLLNEIKVNIDDIQKSIQDLKISKPDEIYKALSTTLLPIIYLTKHAAFEEEAECRVLYVSSVLDDEIQWEDDRVYVEYKTQLADQYQQDGQSQNYLERIYLGPKADPRAELNLKKCWIDKMREKGMANNEIKIPMIIKSDMPLA